MFTCICISPSVVNFFVDFRRWVHAVFRLNLANSLHCTNPGNELGCEEELKESTVEEPVNDFEIDMLEGMVVEIFGISTFNDEVMD